MKHTYDNYNNVAMLAFLNGALICLYFTFQSPERA
jgi:hypothetical protein